MNESTNVKSTIEMNNPASREGLPNPALRKRIHTITQDILLGLAREMLDKADDALFDLANKADSNVSQQLYFDAMRDIRIKRHSIEKGYRAALSDIFLAFENGKKVKHDLNGYSDILGNGKLELIGDEEMESCIAIYNMAEKQERQCYQGLYEVTARLGHLYHHDDLQLQDHPVSPVAIATAFGETLRPLEITFQVKLIIYKLFDKYVMPGLGQIYQELNTVLVKAGILPKVNHTIKRSQTAYRKPSAQNAVNAVNEPMQGYVPAYGATPDGNWETVPVQGPVQDFGMPGFSCTANQSSPGAVNTLSALQGYMRKHGYPEGMRPLAIGKNIIQGFRELGYESVSGSSQSDEQIINTVSMIFDYIMDDMNIPQDVKESLTSLQIPFLKLALLDKNFLRQKQHPAWVLLNQMGQASVGWSSIRDKGDLPYKLDAIVNSILENFGKDANLFVKLRDDFESYLKEDNERNRIFEERTRKTMEGKERIQYAKNRIDAWIHLWTSRDGTPQLITTFLRHIWKSTMLYLMHRFGEDSREWKYHIKLINALLWSVQAGKDDKEVTRLIRILPNIIRGLQRSMLLVSTHNRSMQAFLEGLAECHSAIIREGYARKGAPGNPARPGVDNPASRFDEVVKPVYDEMPEEGSVINVSVDPDLENIVEEVVLETPEPPPYHEEDEIRDEFDALAREMKCGTWVELQYENGEGVRAKLAWRSELSGKCLFVGRNGMKVAERTTGGLAADLRGDRCRVLAEQPLLDRAMSAVKSTLEQSVPAPGVA